MNMPKPMPPTDYFIMVCVLACTSCIVYGVSFIATWLSWIIGGLFGLAYLLIYILAAVAGLPTQEKEKP